jgi:hypothetical protein
LAFFTILIYFSCLPTSNGIVVATNGVSMSGTTLTIKDTSDHEYIVKDSVDNSYSEIYYSTSGKTSYIFYVNSDKGKLNFRVTDDRSDATSRVIWFGLDKIAYGDIESSLLN